MTPAPGSDVIVIGAGVAGLTCAGGLRDLGVDVHVLEKSRGVGGRCATRRIDGVPVDHGLAFYHGDDPAFLAALHSVEPSGPLSWPQRIHGTGAPCQPRSLDRGQRRLAFAAGVTAFPKHLARGIPLDLETRAIDIDQADDVLEVSTETGRVFRAPTVILAVPAGQVARLLRTLSRSWPEIRVACDLLDGISMVRSHSVIAGYPPASPVPEWDVCYPEGSAILQMASRDSSKRRAPQQQILVFQTRPRWSAAHWEDEPKARTGAVLEEARRLFGGWVLCPTWVETRRWRFARLSGGDSLTAPLLVDVGKGLRIGIVGEAMSADGGVQAAWSAGRKLVRRLSGESS